MIRLFGRLLFIAGCGTALYYAAYLQEWAVYNEGMDEEIRRQNLELPLRDPRIVVNFNRYTLSLYSGETLVRRFDCAVGECRQAGVLSRLAQSTPLGEYVVTAKLERTDTLKRGARFLKISFPNQDDVEKAYENDLLSDDQYERCLAALRAGDPLPADLPIGGDIGIQGNYFAMMSPNFTDGSLALSNADIIELFKFIPIGTPVLIE